MNLDQIFSREDVAVLIECAHGRRFENFDCELVTFDAERVKSLTPVQQAMFHMDHDSEQELVVRFGDHQFPDWKVVITMGGDLSYRNVGGDVRHRFAQPLRAYDLVVRRFKEAGVYGGEDEPGGVLAAVPKRLRRSWVSFLRCAMSFDELFSAQTEEDVELSELLRGALDSEGGE